MKYQEIKRRLSNAAFLVDAGDFEKANSEIQSMAGKGITGNDIHFILGSERIGQLKRHLKRKRRRGGHQ